MPKLAKQLLLRQFDNSPPDLYRAMQSGGDGFFCEGTGGLGRGFKTSLAKEAFLIDTARGGTMQTKARDIKKLWELAETFNTGSKQMDINKNTNKYIICLVFIIMQETTPSSIPYQKDAYAILLDDIYGSRFDYKSQMLSNNRSGMTVHMKINEYYEAFKKKLNVSPQQTTTTLANSPSHEYSAPLSRAPTYHRNSLSDIHRPINNGNISPPPLAYFSQSNSPQSGSNPRQISAPAEFKLDVPEPVLPAETITVNGFIKKMLEETQTNNFQFTPAQVKVAQMIYFIKHIDDLTLPQLRELCKIMDKVQTSQVLLNDTRFSVVRMERNFYRRWMAPQGNTETWQRMGNSVQKVMLEKLTVKEYKTLHPEYTEEEINNQDPERLLKHPLEQSVYLEYYHLFKTSFSRHPKSPPKEYKQYCNRYEKKRAMS